jgi:hypothetical protein
MDDGDLLLVGKPHGKVTMPPLAYAKLSPLMKTQLRNVEIANQSDITLRIVGNKALFQPWLDQHPMPGNSDFVPYLDSNADRDRFFSQGMDGIGRDRAVTGSDCRSPRADARLCRRRQRFRSPPTLDRNCRGPQREWFGKSFSARGKRRTYLPSRLDCRQASPDKARPSSTAVRNRHREIPCLRSRDSRCACSPTCRLRKGATLSARCATTNASAPSRALRRDGVRCWMS